VVAPLCGPETPPSPPDVMGTQIYSVTSTGYNFNYDIYDVIGIQVLPFSTHGFSLFYSTHIFSLGPNLAVSMRKLLAILKLISKE
jgi:hypothetical protein